MHAAQQVAVGHAGGAEEDVVAAHEVVGVQDAVEVVAGIDGLPALGVVLRPQPSLQLAADALQRAGRDDALRRAADAEQHVDAGGQAGRGDRARDVAVGDEADAGAGLPDLFDDLLVPRPVQDADGDVGDGGVLRLGDPPDVLRDRRGQVDLACRVRADGELFHVEHRGGVEHRATLGDREHREGVRHALRHQRGAVDRVHGDVAVRPVAVADLFAVVEHGRFVFLALPDHDDAAHAHRADQRAHRVDGRAVTAVLVPAADPPAGRHRGGFGDPDELHREVAVRCFATAGGGGHADLPDGGTRRALSLSDTRGRSSHRRNGESHWPSPLASSTEARAASIRSRAPSR